MGGLQAAFQKLPPGKQKAVLNALLDMRTEKLQAKLKFYQELQKIFA
jgi:hypothetical protein